MISFISLKASQKFLVVGPIYDHINKLLSVEQMFPQYEWIIFNSGLCYPNEDLEEVNNRLTIMNQYIATGKVIYNAGKSDYLLLTKLPVSETNLEKWIRERPNVVVAQYPGRAIVVVDGGIPDNIVDRRELNDNLEASFISQYKNKPWHKNYNGRLGYVISNNPLTQQRPQYYNYSVQLGNQYDHGSVYAQEVGEHGLKQTILL